MNTYCRIDFFGGLRVSIHDRSFERFQTQKTGALLAYLALHSDRSHSREVLADLLWPDGDPNSVRNRLNQAVSSLRRQLHPPDAPALVLVSDHFSLRINAQSVTTDVQDFLSHLSAAARERERQAKLSHLIKGVSLYSGELLAGYFEEWVLSQRLVLADQYTAALQEIVRICSRIGDPEMGIKYCTKLLAVEPNDVRTHIDLIDLYDRADRQATALRQYDEMVRILSLTGEPIPDEARLLRRRVERSMSEAMSPGLPKAKPSLASREREEVDRSIVPTEADSDRLIARDNIPHFINRFVGRADELTRIHSALLTGNRLICLSGLAGMGKTRLAVAAAEKFRDRFARRLILNVAGKDFTTECLPAVKSLLVNDADASNARFRELAADLPSVVMILDGMDSHGGEAVDFVTDLLEVSPHLVIVITSQVQLGIPEAIEIVVGPLPMPTTTGEFDEYKPRDVKDSQIRELATNEAVALFIARAQAVKADFQLTCRTAGQVVKLIRQLDGIPLAIELAAAWARSMTVGQMIDSLDHRFEFLASTHPEITGRHRSLLTALDESFGLLTPELRTCFLRLTIVTGSYDAAFARDLLEMKSVGNVIDSLVAGSFLTTTETRHGLQYSLLNTIREYGLQQQSPDELDESTRVLVNVLRDRLKNHPDESADYYRNIPRVLEYLESHDRHEEALELVASLSNYWQVEGALEDGAAWIRRLLKPLTQESGQRFIYAEAALAQLEWLQGHYAHAKSRLESIIEVADETESWIPRLALAREFHRTGDYAEEEALARFVVDSAREWKDLTMELRAALLLANCLTDQMRFDEAQAIYLNVLYSARMDGRRAEQRRALQGLACLAMERQQFEAASQWMTEAAAESDDGERSWRRALLYIDQARLALRRELPLDALAFLRSAVTTSMGTDLVIWRIAYAGAVAYLELREYAAAAQLLGFTQHYLERCGQTKSARDLADFDEILQRCRHEFGSAETDEFVALGRSLESDRAMMLVKSSRIST